MKTPDVIRNAKPKDFGPCTIHRVAGHYYVYQATSYWDKERRKPIKKTGKCVGKITEENGFIPNKYGAGLRLEREGGQVADSQ